MSEASCFAFNRRKKTMASPFDKGAPRLPALRLLPFNFSPNGGVGLNDFDEDSVLQKSASEAYELSQSKQATEEWRSKKKLCYGEIMTETPQSAN